MARPHLVIPIVVDALVPFGPLRDRLVAHDRRAHRRRVHIAHATERLVKDLLLGVGPWPLRKRAEIPKQPPICAPRGWFRKRRMLARYSSVTSG